MGMGVGGMGAGGAVVLLVLSLLFGRNFFSDSPLSAAETSGGPVEESPEEARLVEFVSFVLDDAQATWTTTLPEHGTQYRDARLVLFRNDVSSGCGAARSAMGPFYCPLDEKVYIDLAFYDELRARFGAPGDFAQAYVIAHEIGHHVQHITGTSARVRELQERRPGEANALSVRLELQADCYAGVWAHSTSARQLLEQGDAEEALGAAAAIGDDRLQRQAGGEVRPESFTHGTAAQRVRWFKTGFESGDPRSCDTFAGGI
jgi:predicted metalloprotease